jgi:hypothetical protein
MFAVQNAAPAAGPGPSVKLLPVQGRGVAVNATSMSPHCYASWNVLADDQLLTCPLGGALVPVWWSVGIRRELAVLLRCSLAGQLDSPRPGSGWRAAAAKPALARSAPPRPRLARQP